MEAFRFSKQFIISCIPELFSLPRSLSLLPTERRTLPTGSEDVLEVAGAKVLVDELVVASQGEHCLVLVSQKTMLDLYVTRPGDVHDVLIVCGVSLPFDLICRWVAAPCEIGPHLLNGVEDLIGDVRAVEAAICPYAANVEHEHELHRMRRSYFRIAARVRPVEAERLVKRALRVELLEHGDPEHEFIHELRLNKSWLRGSADPLKL